MKIKVNNYDPKSLGIKYFQEGGEIAAEAPEAAPAPEATPEQGGDPAQQIIQAAMQAIQTQDGQLALQVCQALVEMAGGAGAPAPTEQPVYRKGGRLVKWIKK